MKCIWCGEKTTWDESFGPRGAITCPKCYQAMVQGYLEKFGGRTELAEAYVFTKLRKFGNFKNKL